MQFETIQTLEVVKEVNGDKVTFDVAIEVAEDDTNPDGDFDFGDEVENAEYLARFRSGELFMGLIRVTAKAIGCKGTDYLGACHLHSFPGPCDTDTIEAATEHGMVNVAVDECISSILERAKELKAFA